MRKALNTAKRCEVPHSKLRWSCPSKLFKFRTTKEVKQWSGTIGQDRAEKALEIGLRMNAPGYNLFVTGVSGTGRLSTIRSLMDKLPADGAKLKDLCYVYNFQQPDSPILLTFPAGRGKEFQTDMEEFIEHTRRNIPIIFEDENYLKQREAIIEKYQQKENTLFREFEERIKKRGFLLIQYPIGSMMKLDIAPEWENQPINFQQLDELVLQGKVTQQEAERLKSEYSSLKLELNAVLRKSRALNREMTAEVEKMAHETALLVVEGFIDDLKEKYKNNDRVVTYLNDVLEHVLKNLNKFSSQDVRTGEQKGSRKSGQDPFLEYRVNLILQNKPEGRPPVIIETYPTYTNLFGTIEKEADRSGFYTTDFTKIKGGSLLAADGGYLIIHALDALIEPGVWKTLKRVLKSRLLEIQSFDSYLQLNTSVMKPEPIDVNVKLIMIGDPFLYGFLYNYEDDFKKIFKVKVDFDTEVPLNEKFCNKYASFIKRVCEDENLLPVTREGVMAAIEYGVREAGRTSKITAKIGKIADVVREANFWANKDSAKAISAEHIDKALKEQQLRHDLVAQKIQEMIDENTIFIDTRGEKVGQVNGLSVYSLGDYAFGKPTRITASVALGKAGIINIEREASLSGPTHDKGVLILTGYLRGKYARDFPLTLSASIGFEQSYGPVDGDSASSTEMYAIISAITGIPLRQDVAVTGSLNQKGEIQPIGGVNLKIEGFFETCRAKGLTGTQGVMIPKANIEDLMLKKEVVEAVKKGKFHIWAVSTIDEGIEILTNMPAGKRNAKGEFPPDSVNGCMVKSLREMAEKLQKFGKDKDKNSKKESEKEKKDKKRKKKQR